MTRTEELLRLDLERLNKPSLKVDSISKPPTCKCRIPLKSSTLRFSSLQWFFETFGRPHCPLHGVSQKSVCFGMRAMLPALLNYAVEISLMVKQNGSTIQLMPKLAISCFVERRFSPAFMAMDKAIATAGCKPLANDFIPLPPPPPRPHRISGNAMPASIEEKRNIIIGLHQKLLLFFATGQASPRDQDPAGITLLHVSRARVTMVMPPLQSLTKLVGIYLAGHGFASVSTVATNGDQRCV